MIFLGDRGACETGVLARVCLVGRAASAGLALVVGTSLVSCATSTFLFETVRFGGAVALAVLVVRAGSGSIVSARFDRVARVVVALGSSASSSIGSCCAVSSSGSGSDFFDRVALVFGPVAAAFVVDAAFAVDAAVARRTGFLRNVRLASCCSGSSVCPVRAPRRVATMLACDVSSDSVDWGVSRLSHQVCGVVDVCKHRQARPGSDCRAETERRKRRAAKSAKPADHHNN